MFRRFIRDEGGNFGIILGLALFPLVGLLGAAFDYSQLSHTRERMRSAADSAVLAAARDAGSFDQFQTLSEQYLSANLPDIPVTMKSRPGPKSVRVTIAGIYETSFMALAGVDSIDMNVEVEVAVQKFSSGSVGPSASEISQMLDILKQAEKELMRQVSLLAPRDQERARRQVRDRFASYREQVKSGRFAESIHLMR